MNNETLARGFLRTAEAVVAMAMKEVQRESPKIAQMVSNAARDGSFFRVTTCLSPAGMKELDVVLVFQTGVTFELINVEFGS